LLLLAPAAVAIGALYFYLSSGRYESTENAALQTGLIAISAQVSGTVIAVEVDENQRVRTGQVLFRLNPDTYRTAVAEAEAQLATARTEVIASRASYRQSQSDLAAAQARLAYAQSEIERQKTLHASGISSQGQYDEAMMMVRTAQQTIDAAQAKGESVLASLSGKVDAPAETQPAVRRAQAQLDRARIALDDTVVYAPQDGIVTHVHDLQVGNSVTASRQALTMTGTHFWLNANFKENQLRYMRVGQPATVRLDAYPDLELRAHIASFSPGTGNSFSLLPAENASGNWVKVMQRLPVEFELDAVPQGVLLHAGLSASMTVDTGHRRHLFGADTPPTGTLPAAPAGAVAAPP